VYEELIRRRTLGVAETSKSPPWAKEYATLHEPTENLVQFPRELNVAPLDEVLRDGARRLFYRAPIDSNPLEKTS